MKRVTKFLSLAIAVVLSVSVFTVNANAMSAAGEAHRRVLTAEEVTTIYKTFNAKVYAKMYPDVVKELGEDEMALYTHFVTFGIWEQRQPSEAFNVNAYATLNPDLSEKFGDDIVAYYMYYANHMAESGTTRSMPTYNYAIWHDTNVYSVYDFTAGQKGPNKGAVAVCTRNYHPGIVIRNADGKEIWPSVGIKPADE
ncbi:hypothetical protein [Pseudobutyrivibrio ruminis]|uniref:hypothetical protein n=1 Tax=Pseudobutyrivibrio ruminis TaxID=46206 RepID=UPI000409D8B8|nr:hypothetical protein [Pseudobutyrivibrio ruminis]